MFKILFLLLAVLVLNKADGTLASVSTEDLSNFDDGKEGEVPSLSETPYGNEIALQKRSNLDKLMRRSSLDKNFMRFGRSGFRERCCEEKDSAWFPETSEYSKGEETPQTFKKHNSIPLARKLEDNSIRFGRSNFMRFGRDDNFMRFGRGQKDNFMRFGRGEKDNFMRFGLGGKDSFTRFGRGNDNFMRFGRKYGGDSDEMSTDNFYPSIKSDNFMRFGKSSKIDGNFLRFGKSDGKGIGFIRFGRNGTNFLRFGRGSSEDTNKVDENVDAEADASENDAIIRRKRTVSGDKDYAENKEIAYELPEKLTI